MCRWNCKETTKAKAFYGVINDAFSRLKTPLPEPKKIAADAALEIDRIIQDTKLVDWKANLGTQNEMRKGISLLKSL